MLFFQISEIVYTLDREITASIVEYYNYLDDTVLIIKLSLNPNMIAPGGYINVNLGLPVPLPY